MSPLCVSMCLKSLNHLEDPETPDTVETTAVLTKLFYLCSASFFGMLSALAMYYVRKVALLQAAQQGSNNPHALSSVSLPNA